MKTGWRITDRIWGFWIWNSKQLIGSTSQLKTTRGLIISWLAIGTNLEDSVSNSEPSKNTLEVIFLMLRQTNQTICFVNVYYPPMSKGHIIRDTGVIFRDRSTCDILNVHLKNILISCFLEPCLYWKFITSLFPLLIER